MPPKRKSTALEIIPPKTITLTEDQFRELGEKIQSVRDAKKPNPMPWIVVGLVAVLVAIVGGMGMVVYIMRPTPIQTQMVAIPPTVTNTPLPTVTKTPTSTSTPDMTRTMEGSPAWQVIRDYISYAMRADFGSAWGCLSQRCKNTMCMERWNGDYLAFQEFWRSWGRMEIRKLTPEILTTFEAQAFVVLYFYNDELPHDYRFYLKKVDGVWKINSVEYVAPMR
jgi:hypothetical protein